MEKYKVLITTSGIGSRLKELTKDTNKALIKIGDKEAIRYVIDCYPEETEFVVTVGYLADQVKNFLVSAYPEHKFTFIIVDKYEGKGSSLGYSMLCAKNELQCPFIFHCCDTIVTDKILAPDKNWTAGYAVDDPAQYRTLNIKDGKVLKIDDKGVNNSNLAHIGLVGIYDYKSFWRNLEKLYNSDPGFEPLNDTFTINEMLKEGTEFNLWPVSSWHDTGNPEALFETVKKLTQK